MSKKYNSRSILPEFIFQVILLVIVFIFYSYDRRQPSIQPYKIAFFLNYVAASLVINYYLLPHFLYKKRYWGFIVYCIVVVALVIVVEEGILEQIYFPDTRGTSFPGVFKNLLSAMPTITILAGFKFAWDALRQQREVEILQSAVRESELQYLKSQINPHFLFNNLNNLYAYALEKSPKTPEIILELSGVLRYMLYDCRAEYVPLTKEIEQLSNFINLSAMQLEGRGEVLFNPEIGNNSFKIAPLILSVFIENAFKHSASSQTDNILIDVSVNLSTSGTLLFACSNTFMDESNTVDLSKGIGLENVKKRLSLLYPNSHNLKIETKNHTYTVTLLLELEKSESQ